MKLSIIVPVFRVEATLDRCMRSIVDQTFTDFEVILVDDGSTDRCPEMSEAWARRDQRIRVIHKENGGLSDARNVGIDSAQGELITFVDSDDFLHRDTYAQVVPQASDCDIVEFPVYRHYGAERQSMLMFEEKHYTDMKEYWLDGRAYEHTYAWNKIYRRCLFDKVRFPVGKVFEDVFTLPQLLDKAQNVVTTDKGLYYYCDNSKGITQTAGGAELSMLLDGHLRVIGRWCDDAYYMHVLNIQIDVAEQSAQKPVLTFRSVNPCSPGLSSTLRAKAFLQNIIGIKGICRFNQLIHRMRNCHS